MLTFAYLCLSYPFPGSIAMSAFLQASLFCEIIGSRCNFISFRNQSINLSLCLEVSSLLPSSLLFPRQHYYHEIVLNVLLTRFAGFFWRVAFSWHPPVFFSSDFGHVTTPLSCACHVTVRSCCGQRGGCAGLCHG